jgi:hypothetical protein
MKMNDINEEKKGISLYMSLCLEDKMANMKTSLWALKAKGKGRKITLYKNLTKMSKVRGYQVGVLTILASYVL